MTAVSDNKTLTLVTLGTLIGSPIVALMATCIAISSCFYGKFSDIPMTVFSTTGLETTENFRPYRDFLRDEHNDIYQDLLASV